MKVAIDCNILRNVNTGVENYALNLISSVTKIKPILMHDRNIKHDIFKEYDEYIIPQRLRFPGSRTFYSFFMPPKMPDTDIIHLPTVESPTFIRPKQKLVVTVHDITPLIHPKWHPARRVIYFRHFLPRLLKMADRIIAVSRTTRDDLVKVLNIDPDKIDVIYSGVSESFRPLRKNNNILKKYKIKTPYILYLGTLEPRKNIARLINAYIKSGVKEKLVIAGPKGWLYEDIFRIAKKHKKRIIFTGFVSPDDIPYLYSSAKMFVYPSLYEGFGFPVLEAMRCKTPVITSKISSTGEIAKDHALLIDPYDIDEIAGAIRLLSKDKKLAGSLIRSGYDHALEFTWKRYGSSMLRIYRQLLKE